MTLKPQTPQQLSYHTDAKEQFNCYPSTFLILHNQN